MCSTDQSEDEPQAALEGDPGEAPEVRVLLAEESIQAQGQPMESSETVAATLPVEPLPNEAAHEAPPRILAAIQDLGNALEQRLSAMQSLIDRELRAEATRERIVDRLHAELQEYKQDLLLKVLRPVFIDLIQLHDDIGKMVEAQPADDPERAAAVRGTLESIRTAIEDILYRQGVEPFQNPSEEFDPRRQRAVTTAATDQPERNKTIAGRIRPGFQAGEKLIRPEIVSVYTWKG